MARGYAITSKSLKKQKVREKKSIQLLEKVGNKTCRKKTLHAYPHEVSGGNAFREL